MSAVLELPVPTRSRWSQVPAVLAAVAGPFAWRLLWPLAVWLMAAAVAWVSLAGRNPYDEVGRVDEFSRWSTLPSGILLLAGIAAIPVLWLGGARYAVGLGHDRSVVYGVTTVVSLALQAVLHLISLAAGLLELRTLGTGGVHVFAMETSDKFGTHSGLWNASWVLGLYYVMPFVLVVLATSVALVRFGLAGLIALPAGMLVLGGMVLVLSVTGGVVAASADPAAASGVEGLVGLLLLVVLWTVPLVGGWWVFRRTAV